MALMILPSPDVFTTGSTLRFDRLSQTVARNLYPGSSAANGKTRDFFFRPIQGIGAARQVGPPSARTNSSSSTSTTFSPAARMIATARG